MEFVFPRFRGSSAGIPGLVPWVPGVVFHPLPFPPSISPSSLSLTPAAAPCSRTPSATEGSVTPDENVPLADAYAEAMHRFHLTLSSRTLPPWQ